jgi:hypothetical protein
MTRPCPLIEAIKRDAINAALILLKRGADPNIPDETGLTPLMIAVGLVHKANRLFLADGSECFRSMWVVRKIDRKIIKILLEYGADPDVPRRGYFQSYAPQSMVQYADELKRTRWEYLTRLMTSCDGTFEEGLILLILSY